MIEEVNNVARALEMGWPLKETIAGGCLLRFGVRRSAGGEELVIHVTTPSGLVPAPFVFDLPPGPIGSEWRLKVSRRLTAYLETLRVS